MAQSFPSLIQIAAYLNRLLQVNQFRDDQNGIYQPTDHPVKTLGLLLEPFNGLDEWIKTHSLDALFLHRPWQLQPSDATFAVGILAYHLSFDERLTTGLNPWLADALGLTHTEPFGQKEGRPLGMVGKIESQSFDQFRNQVRYLFDGEEALLEGNISSISRVVIVGAMTKMLIRGALDQNIDVYITGQIRKHAIEAVYKERMHILAIGHQRSEVWGLKMLASLLQAQWPAIKVVLAHR